MNRISNYFGKMNHALKELLCGVFLWGIVLGLVFVWSFESRISFLGSLAAGVLAAAGMAFHMCLFIEDSLELTQDDAVKHMRKGTVLRTLAAMALFVLAWRQHGSVVAVFLGLFTLKLAAYTQPLIHKAAVWIRNKFC